MAKEKITTKQRTTTVAVSAGEIKSVRFVNSQKTGYRVIKDGKIGIYGVTGTMDDSIAWQKAEANLENEIPYPVKEERDFNLSVYKTPKNMQTDQQFVENVRTWLKKLNEVCPNFIFSNNIYKTTENSTFENDAERYLHYETGYYMVALIIKERSSANVFDLGYSFVGQSFDTELMTKDVQALYEAYYNDVEISEGEHYVLTSVGDLAYGKIFGDVVADHYCSGSSIFANKAGERVFSDKVSIYEDRNPNTTYTAPFFDDEGVVNPEYRNYIFKNGVFTRPVASKADAAKYGIQATGSASSTYDGVPRTSVSNVTVADSGKTVAELLQGKDAIYLVMASGGDTTPDGNFATPVQMAFLYRDGKLVGKIPPVNVSGNVFDLYGKSFVGQATDSISFTGDDRQKPLIVKMNVTK